MKQTKEKITFNFIIPIVCILLLLMATRPIAVAATVEIVQKTPEDKQFLELRAVQIIPKGEGNPSQLIMELWGNEIEMKGFNVRFWYDKTKLETSDLTTNEVTYDSSQYFQFTNEFAPSLDFFEFLGESGMVDASLTMNKDIEESEHIVDRGGGIGKVVDTRGSVRLGTMSFRLTDSNFKVEECFHLQPNPDSSPETGIYINLDMTSYFDQEKTFRFTDMIGGATLSKLTVSSGQKEEPTYKEYLLTPEFTKEVTEYEITLLEYLDNVDITPRTDLTDTILKIKHPKRDEQGNLLYDPESGIVEYIEHETPNNTSANITLNDLGQPDTVITITVVPERGDEKEYTLTIKRPYGTIKGKTYTIPGIREECNQSTIRIYSSDETNTAQVWDNINLTGDNLHEDLIALNSRDYDTNEDGTFEIFVVPGKYDILADKPGFLDHIYREQTITEGDILDLDQVSLYAGDINKDGVVEMIDQSLVLFHYGEDSSYATYEERFDINADGQIEMVDESLIMFNYSQTRIIEEGGGV